MGTSRVSSGAFPVFPLPLIGARPASSPKLDAAGNLVSEPFEDNAFQVCVARNPKPYALSPKHLPQSLTHTPNHTHIHTHTHTQALTLTLTLTPPLTHAHTCTHEYQPEPELENGVYWYVTAKTFGFSSNAQVFLSDKLTEFIISLIVCVCVCFSLSKCLCVCVRVSLVWVLVECASVPQ